MLGVDLSQVAVWIVVAVILCIPIVVALCYIPKKLRKEKINEPKPTETDEVGEIRAETPRHRQIKCQCCEGYYIYRERRSDHSGFAGCSNYSNPQIECRSTLNIEDFIRRIIREYGVNVYAWEKKCQKCHSSTTVYSYYLTYDLKEFIPPLEQAEQIGLGDIRSLDRLVAQQFPGIELTQSKTMGSVYIANRCAHCGALQGKNHVVDDPDNEEIWDILMRDGDMSPYLAGVVQVTDSDVIEDIVAAINSYLR